MPVRVVRVELYKPVIAAVLQDDVGRAVTKTTIRVLNRAKVLTPVDTGHLRGSHQFRIVRMPDTIRGEVYTNVRYALPVHEGVKARDIYPKTKKALAFRWRGRNWVLAKVHQGPRKGRPWLRRALREVGTLDGYKMTRGAQYGPPASGI